MTFRRHTAAPLTPEEQAARNRERNIALIMNGPRRPLRDRLLWIPRRIEDLWSHHVRHRRLHRALRLRLHVDRVAPAEPPANEP
ncbi:hypothetical protein [Streptomyces lichenis]|uniref:Integrase n=1 Tax=Streptomyces lichenis TaxID=2306967 RepID=A0ABT0I9M4_9ACTN|nr:hypothetical protein [Streptomyces lichenis]MCK8677987.1 hypothetical protein [Streptomyces lichenis]